MADRVLAGDPPWLVAAFRDLGLREVDGPGSSPRITEMYRAAGAARPEQIDDSTVSWCSAAMNAWFVESGLDGTGSLLGRSWLARGTRIEQDGPLPRGAIAVFRYDNDPTHGHVCIVLEDNGDTIREIGGNQSNTVSIATRRRAALIGAVWPDGYPRPQTKEASMSEPLSIRTNNPGAIWGGAHARKWGAIEDIKLGDAQGNHIAVFPSAVQGAAAQFDLWRTKYTGMTLDSAITRWSGGNSSPAYTDFISKNSGIDPIERITVDLLSGPRGLALMKAQARWEAGRPYPLSDAEWARAQAMVFGAQQPAPIPDVAPPRKKDKPAYKSKTHWGGLLAVLSGITGAVQGFFDKLDNPYSLAAFIVIVVLIVVGGVLVIKGRIDVGRKLTAVLNKEKDSGG